MLKYLHSQHSKEVLVKMTAFCIVFLFVFICPTCQVRVCKISLPVDKCETLSGMQDMPALAHRIRKSEVCAWDRNSYVTHVISHQKEIFHVNSVCIGCIGRHVTLSLGSHHFASL